MSLLSTIVGTAFPPAGIVMNVLGGGKALAGRAFDWITASAAHLLAVALALALGWGWFGHHEAGKWERQAAHEKAGRRADRADDLRMLAQWQTADGINRKSLDTLLGVVRVQNGTIELVQSRALAKQADAVRRIAAMAALTRDVAKANAAIEAENTDGCDSGKAVMAARGNL